MSRALSLFVETMLQEFEYVQNNALTSLPLIYLCCFHLTYGICIPGNLKVRQLVLRNEIDVAKVKLYA